MSEAVLNAPILPNLGRVRRMSDFLQLHWFTSYAAALPNRDRDGEPKTIIWGGVLRGRIASQCLKRTCRCGTLFNHVFGDLGEEYLGERTKELGGIVYHRLIEGGVAEPIAEQWTLILAAVFGPTKPKNAKKKDTLDHLKNETMFLVSPAEKKALLSFVDRIIAEKLIPAAVKGKEEFEKEAQKLRPQILQRRDTSVDRALWGRMFASDTDYSAEASMQVAHSITVHALDVTDDMFAVVDDIKDSEDFDGEDRGGGHLGESPLIGAVFYNNLNIRLQGLWENLGDAELTVLAVKTVVESFLVEFPRAKGNSCAHQGRPLYGRLEWGQQAPRTLSTAFLNPIEGKNMGRRAIDRLREESRKIDKTFGPCYSEVAEFDTEKEEGSLADLLALAERAARSVVSGA